MTKEKEEKKPNLFEILLSTIAQSANDQNLSLSDVLGQLRLVEDHLIQSVKANAQKVVEQNASDDKQDKTDASQGEA